MARHDRTDRGVNRKVPPPKKTYTPPEQEPRSTATQAADDRWLTGWPENDQDTKGGT